MKKSLKTVFLLFIIFTSCNEESEPETNCYECTRLIQTLDKEAVLILTQEDQFELCNKTKEEILEYELENTKEEATSTGGKREFFTSCELSQ